MCWLVGAGGEMGGGVVLHESWLAADDIEKTRDVCMVFVVKGSMRPVGWTGWLDVAG